MIGRSLVTSADQTGPVMAIGGAEDKFRDCAILATFLTMAGGHTARLVIIPTASSIETSGERYKAIFLEMGAYSADIVYIHDRAHGNDQTIAASFPEATGIFMTGGNQLRLSTRIGGTLVEEAIRDRWRRGAIVAGTSAGASILSSHMIAFGTSGPSPRQRMASMVAGFGLVDETIIDQHFRQRDRTGRLMSLISGSPKLLGVGIDEDTAAIFGANGTIDVIGRHSVTIIDGSQMFTDFPEIKGHGGITTSGAVMHTLTAGRRFDRNQRRLLLI
ncbi:MAG TPA: cyanophycinase [Thermomicrobiales bacterium]|nr:cyanophycinase [Thermomicrobiales bacterium]